MQHSTGYIVGFAAAVCLVCALFVAGAAVGLKDRQARQQVVLDRQKKVLTVAGLIEEGAELSRDGDRRDLRSRSIQARRSSISRRASRTRRSTRRTSTSSAALEGSRRAARRRRRTRRRSSGCRTTALVFDVDAGRRAQGADPARSRARASGRRSTAIIALAPDARTIVGITFYEHGETPGLGGEVDNPRWKALWPGRKAFDERGSPSIARQEGHRRAAGRGSLPRRRPLGRDDHEPRRDRTLLRFWLGDDGFGPYLERYRARRAPDRTSRRPRKRTPDPRLDPERVGVRRGRETRVRGPKKE